VTTFAITVLGHDRPGIIARTTGILAGLGLNLEDSSMTLICSGPVAGPAVEQALGPLGEDGSLTVSVREVPAEGGAGPVGTTYVLTVHGGDRPGIVTAVAAEVARPRGNITDLTTRLAGEMYLLVAEVDLPPEADADDLRAVLGSAAGRLGVEVHLRQVESDDL
jgi:glycine cleavage system transcriptional repressor